MTRFPAIAALVLPAVLALGGCNENTAIGNDREAQLDPAPTPAPIMAAEAALANVSAGLIKPETMGLADIEALGGREGRCAVKLTEVAFPSFLYEPGGPGAIKLNGKLIVLPRVDEARFAQGDLSVTLRADGGEEGTAGLPTMEMIVVPPGAEDELGYDGFVQCYEGPGE